MESEASGYRPENQNLDELTQCPTCEKRFIVFTKKANCLGCGKGYCTKCLNNWIYFPEKYQYDTVQPCCSDCYKELSSIDNSVHFEQFGSRDPTAKTIVLLHPGTLTRQFWQYHASILSQKYRIVALDLPGHGSRMDETLSVTSAHQAIVSVIKEVGTGGKKIVLWGHGMGAYIAISFSGVYPEICSAVVASNCGAPRDQKSSALWMANQSIFLTVTKNSTLASRPLVDLKMNQIDPKMIIESFLRPGTYYGKWDGILETINVTNYLELLRNFPGKLFFINGSNCERDAEERFVGAAQEACLEILDGANEWFIIDERYRERVLELIDEFLGTIDWDQKLAGISFEFEDIPIVDSGSENSESKNEEPEGVLPENLTVEEDKLESREIVSENVEIVEDSLNSDDIVPEKENDVEATAAELKIVEEPKQGDENSQVSEPASVSDDAATGEFNTQDKIEEPVENGLTDYSADESEEKGLPIAPVVSEKTEDRPKNEESNTEMETEVEPTDEAEHED